MATKKIDPNLPKVLVADRPEPTPPQPSEALGNRPINRQEFVANYLSSSPEQRMASVTLPDTSMTLAEWRSTWQLLLNSPAP